MSERRDIIEQVEASCREAFPTRPKSTSPTGIELGRDDRGYIIVMATGQTEERDYRTVTLALAEDDAMKLAEALQSCAFSEEVHFKWQPEAKSQ